MKRFAFMITAVLIFIISPVFAETDNESAISQDEGEAIEQPQKDKLFVTFNYGATASWLTRIIEQTGRSNFVLRDFLPGLYLNTELQNVSYITPVVRLAAYYPLISSFNNMPQTAKSPLNFATDLFAGARYKTEWSFLRWSAGLGLHLFFMTADRWNYLNLGLAAAAGIEVAISLGWTLLIDGFASIDNGNLGTNRAMEPFDIVYQYQTAIGVRYSRRMPNNSPLIMPKDEDWRMLRTKLR